jgi:uncharacterized protein
VSSRDVGAGHALAPWPYAAVDAVAAARRGWRPVPFHEFVLKVHQRCNLACDYCYVYELRDQSWRDRPAVMPYDVAKAAVAAIGTHVRTHDLNRVQVVLHGGEPLLAGLDRLLRLVSDLRSAVPLSCEMAVGLQTNGLLLTETILHALVDHGIRVGLSLDGPPEINDLHRRHADGRGSYAGISQALTLLRADYAAGSFAGILCTVDPYTDPEKCYEELVSFAPPSIDFLLPHANWSFPPTRHGDASTPYADWLIKIFDRWYSAPHREADVRLFTDLLTLICGGTGHTEQAGLSPATMLVVESDGAIEQVDALKSAYPGAAATGLNVFTDSLDAAMAHPGVIARQLGRAALSEECLGCDVHRICGAGHYAHRFRAGAGFRNPTVYCADMMRLIRHIHGRLVGDLGRRLPGWA